MKERILQELGVLAEFDVAAEAERRISFLADYLKQSGAKAYVLGISGGIDSTTSAILAQRAVERLRAEDYDAKFIAVRLPYGVQADEADAQKAIDAINPDDVRTVNIQEATNKLLLEVFADEKSYDEILAFPDAQVDFVKGNIKARQRMIAQYAIAGANNGLVIGTDHNAEAVMGFYTKFGDGAADITPLVGLNKRRVRRLGYYLGVPSELVNKTPTADLEDLAPGKPDEVAHGVTYDDIDTFLEGGTVSPEAEAKIIETFTKTIHKRALPVAP